MSVSSPMAHQQAQNGSEMPSVGPSSDSGGSSSSTPAPPLPFSDHSQMMPAFFANPFMSPFLPQQPDTAGPAMVSGGAPPAPGASPFFLTPQGYQEMMQQYFQQMMMAAQTQQTAAHAGAFPVMPNMQFPMPSMPPFYNPAQQMMMMQGMQNSPPQAGSEADPSERLSTGMGDLSMAGDTPEHSSRSTASATSTPAPFASPLPSRPLFVQSHPQAELFGSTMEEGRSEGATRENGDKDDDEQGATPEVTSNGDESPSSEGKEGEEKKRKTSQPEGEDERTANLIRKQMSEIEKEISRRAQNKNIKKIDDHGMAELIGTTAPPQFVAHFEASLDAQAALPFTSAPVTPVVPQKESLNQLRNSFAIPDNQPTASPSPSTTSTATVQMAPFPIQMGQTGLFGPGVVAPPQPFPQMQPHPSMLPPPPPASSSVRPSAVVQPVATAQPTRVNPFTTPVPQPFAYQQQMQAAAMGTQPWDASHPSTSEQPHHNGHDSWPTGEEAGGTGTDPVWVLRDSYMKKMQQHREVAEPSERVEDWGEEEEEGTALQPGRGGPPGEEEEEETDRLLHEGERAVPPPQQKKQGKETMVHEPAVLIEGVLFRARYLGSTQLASETRGSKTARMAQAQEAVARVKAPDGEVQPGTDIDLFISTEKIMVLNTDLQRISDTDVRQDILMDHALRTISYIADIGDIVVLMARRMTHSASQDSCEDGVAGIKKSPKVICHVFESDEAAFIAQSIGQAFQVAYVEFLRANGIDDPSYLRQIDYQEVLNSQELLGDELEMFARKETQKDVVVPKKSGEALGVVVVESGWGSMLPTVVLAHLSPLGPASRCNQLNVGDQIIAINGISLVGLNLTAAQTHIRNVKTSTAVRLTVVSTPPVVEVRIRRPDTKYQLGFSVQNGVICSLLRGGIAERGGIRVGHRIIEINGQSVVAVAHERIVHMLATAIGDIHMKTMPTSMFRLLTGQETPNYI